MTTLVYAIIGAAAGLLAIYFGFHFRAGMTVYDGPIAYIGSALAGGVAVVIVRHAIREHFGPIIP